MISDAFVQVFCDYPQCASVALVDLRAGAKNTYLFDEDEVDIQLDQHEWIVKNGNHYCGRHEELTEPLSE